MKALYERRKPTKKELKAAENICNELMQKTASRIIWLSVIKMNDLFGIGEKRARQYIDAMLESAFEFDAYNRDGVAEEVLLRRIKQIIPSVEDLYPDIRGGFL